MSVITVTRFTVDPANVEALRTKHAALVDAIKQADVGLVEAWFGRVNDTEWAGIWRWDSVASLQASRVTPPAPAEAQAAFSLVEAPTVDDFEIFDEL